MMLKIILKGNIEIRVETNEDIETIKSYLENCNTKWVTVAGITTRIEDIRYIQEV